MKLDFSQFHPLDHYPWQRRCREFYGGPARHVYLAWTYRYRDRITGLLWFRWARCPFGAHRWQVWRSGPGVLTHEPGSPGDYGALCIDCAASRPATEDEWF